MGKRIKLQNINFAKVGDGVGNMAKDVAKFVGNHKEEFLGGGLLLAVADSIRVRLGRKKDQKTSVKQQKVTRKHEAEINALRAEVEQAHEANRRVGQLEQIVKNIIEGGGTE